MAINKPKKRRVEISTNGIAHIRATFNNTIVTITSPDGETLAWGSGGSVGFKGTKKATPHAAAEAAQEAAKKVYKQGMKELEVIVKGCGAGRESAIRSLVGSGLIVHKITDLTPIPHNGCRAPKQRNP
ncbi:MAG: 30S ribosomal protein S11 [Bacteroidota bacterium]